MWVAVFCVMQTMCGCFVLDVFKKEPPIDLGQFAEYWDDEGDPKIRPGLVLRINVTAFGVPIGPEMVQEVGANGEILMVMIGSIKCEGLTLVELQDKIVEAYKAYYIEPQAKVNFAYVDNPIGRSPWGEVLVKGAVMREGPVNMPPTRDLKVTRALMLVGGVKPFGDESGVRVNRREKDGTLTRIKVNVKKIGKDARLDLDVILKPGDVIWVPESVF